MTIKVLVDNNTYIDQYYQGEPGVCYYIEEQGKIIVFDVGYSQLYVDNAKKMDIDLSQADYLVLSHGHDDHTKGLTSFPTINGSCRLVAHPHVFEAKRHKGIAVSAPWDVETASKHFRLELTDKPIKLTEQLWFLGEIPRVNDFESEHPIGEHCIDGAWCPDFLTDDSALAYATREGLYIITGCSHAGICNIIEYAKQVTGKDKVLGILGGFHLFDAEARQTKETIVYLAKQQIPQLFPCHCTSFAARAALHSVIPVQEVGVGLTLTW